MLRTHTCGELNESNIGKEAVLCGWVHRRRDHGKLIFIDLRDRYGMTQVTFYLKGSEKLLQADQLRSEFVVSVKGKIAKRPKGTENPKMPTGFIEIQVEDFQIINPSEVPPFEIGEEQDVSEEIKLAYRYLDLRNPLVLDKFILRHKICKFMRDVLDSEKFLEVETPVLTKSTPEGARDYLVPSRVSPGYFYALPQSPQLFKQILMVSGFDKYFQIAKCFRDEDLRADRQPEFTQLDIEMSFVEEDDIFTLVEKLLKKIFKELLDQDLSVPFERITYKEAIEKYKSDKPDLRKTEKNKFVWVVDFPLFTYNDEEKRWDSEHHPFTAPKEDDLKLIDSDDLSKVRARSYDLVLNGVEIGSGSIRIHNKDVQSKIFKIIGLGEDEIKKRFGFLLKAFQYGAPPHGGIALGLDRLIAIVTGSQSIRDVIAFPKTQRAVCPLTDAPSEVRGNQLKDLGIDVKKKEGGNV